MSRAKTPPAFPVKLGSFDGDVVIFDARRFDKVNLFVGDRNTGKSHGAKVVLPQLTQYGMPVLVFDINREFSGLPGAVSLRVGDNYKVQLAEVGLPFLSAFIEDSNPFTETARSAFEQNASRFMEAERKATGFATVSYLLEQAEQGRFWNNEMVNNAIEARLRGVVRSGVFEENASAPTLGEIIEEAADNHGFVVIDLSEERIGRARSLVRGFLRQTERICQQETSSGRGRYPAVMLEEAHMYTAPEEILNLISRGRHLGLTLFFMTNTPSRLPEDVMRMLDNLFVTGPTHASDRRLIAKSALSDDDTLEALAMGLAREQTLVVGKVTNGYPLVVEVDGLPKGWPATGATKSFWAHAA
jgi:uncharacterized protein